MRDWHDEKLLVIWHSRKHWHSPVVTGTLASGFLIMLKCSLIWMPYYNLSCYIACLILFDGWYRLLLTLPSGRFHSFHTCWMTPTTSWCFLFVFLENRTKHISRTECLNKQDLEIQRKRAFITVSWEFNSVGDQVPRAAETTGYHSSERSWNLHSHLLDICTGEFQLSDKNNVFRSTFFM